MQIVRLFAVAGALDGEASTVGNRRQITRQPDQTSVVAVVINLKFDAHWNPPDGYRLRRGLDRNKPRDPAVPFCLSVKIAPAVSPALLLLAPLATFVPGPSLPRPMTKDATKIKRRIGPKS